MTLELTLPVLALPDEDTHPGAWLARTLTFASQADQRRADLCAAGWDCAFDAAEDAGVALLFSRPARHPGDVALALGEVRADDALVVRTGTYVLDAHAYLTDALTGDAQGALLLATGDHIALAAHLTSHP